MQLKDLGWDAFFEDAFEPYAADNLIPARVSARHHGPCELLTENGRMGGLPAGQAVRRGAARGRRLGRGPSRRGRAQGHHRGRPAAAHLVLPQGGVPANPEQVVAANVDTVFIVTAFGFDLNPRRLERYLTAAWDSGSTPVIVVNKLDTAETPGASRFRRACFDGRADPLGQRGHGRGPRRARRVPARRSDRSSCSARPEWASRPSSIASPGASCWRPRRRARAGRGRHTTSHRELVPLPSGALLLDTPGMRELQLWAGEEVLDTTFSEIAQFSAECKFSDCSHTSEPGCAIGGRSGTARSRRSAGRATRSSSARSGRRGRKDARLRSEERKKWAKFSKSRRKTVY